MREAVYNVGYIMWDIEGASRVDTLMIVTVHPFTQNFTRTIHSLTSPHGQRQS